MTTFPMEPDALADVIGMPVAAWPGNCHGVAEAVLTRAPIRGMRLVRGHYHGHVSRQSVYRGGVSQHSWLELDDGRVLDPTRWALEDPTRPAIFIGTAEDYDEAGLRIDAAMPPVFPGQKRGFEPALARLDETRLAAIAEAIGQPVPSDLDPEGRALAIFADRLAMRLKEHPDHLEDPAKLYRAVADAGLKALIKIDLWQRVMQPEVWSVPHGANFTYDAPTAPELRDIEKLFLIFAKFLSVEERDLYIENELNEIGYCLDDLHDALNRLDRWLKHLPEAEIEEIPNDRYHLDTLAVIASDLLGRGYGVDLKVEAYARSLGLKPADLDAQLIRFGKRIGYDLRWL